MTFHLEAARRDPEILVRGSGAVTLAEIQREPDLLGAVKRAIDGDRTAGRFFLTGSANLLLMRHVSESLAGRASYIILWPLTGREQLWLGRCGRWEKLLTTPDAGWRELLASEKGSAEEWRALPRCGGFPTPALELTTAADRRIWFDGYVRAWRTIQQRWKNRVARIWKTSYYRLCLPGAMRALSARIIAIGGTRLVGK